MEKKLKIKEKIKEKKEHTKKVLATKAIRASQKIAIRKAKKDIRKLYTKHEEMINNLMDETAKIMSLEKEEKQPTMMAMICTNMITGFDTQKEMEMVLEMIKKTLEEYNKENKTPK